MCGRFSCQASFEEVAEALGVRRENWKGGRNGTHGDSSNSNSKHKSYNVHPGQCTPVLYRDDEGEGQSGGGGGSLCLRMMKWGLVPSFTKRTANPDYFRMFNARSEGVRTSPVFKRLLRRRRCIVPIQGFYEWKKVDTGTKKRKQPYFVFLEGDQQHRQQEEKKDADVAVCSSSSRGQSKRKPEPRLLLVAGLYDRWVTDTGEEEWTYTMLTTQPCDQIAWLHNRMPVILQQTTTPRDPSPHLLRENVPGDYSYSFDWIEKKTLFEEEKDNRKEEEERELFFKINHVAGLRWHPVTSAVGNMRYNEPDCCEDVRIKTVQEHKGSIQDLLLQSQTKPADKKNIIEGELAPPPPAKPVIGLKLQSSPNKRKKTTTAATKAEDKQRTITSFFR